MIICFIQAGKIIFWNYLIYILLKTKITIICPQLVTLHQDNLGSGIPYMPIIAAYLAAVLREKYDIGVIDSFGENPLNAWAEDRYIIQGITFDETVRKIPADCRYCILYVSTVMANYVLHKTIRLIKENYPLMRIILIENSQGVIGCPLKFIYKDFFDSGADYIIQGECEENVPALINNLEHGDNSAISSIPGIIYKKTDGRYTVNNDTNINYGLDSLPFPAWDLFPVKNYWKLGYSHGPMQGNYLSVMTSRGCPFNCSFCVVPSMNNNKWRARSPKNVVKEFEFLSAEYNVSEFHLEDLNPTTNEKRIIDICRLIIDRDLKITWKLASGSKIETISIDTLSLMKQAGCNYISFSPESGSKKILKLMNKPFKHKFALEMTSEMNRLGIRSQACFVLGFPGEDSFDRFLTQKYIKELTRAGIDEIALFIMTPIPGTKTFDLFKGYSDYSELTFAPTWRNDYPELCRFRNMTYLKFLLFKLIFHPFKVIKQPFDLLRKKFETKSEMNIYRLIKIRKLVKKSARLNIT
jgi:anaerobic magnesium-protoporphyrin IX monomethyl ester cyclase